MLANDQPQVAQKITRLLMPSYFPLRVNVEEACNRCVTLIKRSPIAGARFCEFAAAEGAPLKYLMELFRVLINLVLFPENMTEDQIEGVLDSAMHLCNDLVNEQSFKAELSEMFAEDKMKRLYAAAPSLHSQSSILEIASMISPDDVTGIIEECIGLVTNCTGITDDERRKCEVRSAHRFLLSYDGFAYMLEAFAKVLQKTSFHCSRKSGTAGLKDSNVSLKRQRNKSSIRKDKRVSCFKDDYSVAVGIAWQIKDLLENDEYCMAILSSSYLEQIILALEVIAEVSIMECVTSEYMDLCPVLAYTSLSLHIVTSGIGDKKNRRSNSSTSDMQASSLLLPAKLSCNFLFRMLLQLICFVFDYCFLYAKYTPVNLSC